MNKNLIWFGPVYSYSGYALHNRAMIFELVKLGWNIKLYPTEDYPPTHLIGKDLLLSLAKNPTLPRKETICINLVPPPAIPYYSEYTILFTTLESKTVHPGFLRRCSLFNEVWVPCKMNYKAMRKSGYPKKHLFYCPEGVSSHFWRPNIPKHYKYINKSFTFLYNGDWSYRKGLDILIRAYAKAFSPTDNVRLLLLVHYQGNGEEVSRQRIGTELMQMCNDYNISRLPPIEFIFGHVDDPEMPALFNCADTYVCPTRGEAWGLPIIQAMACGIPPIIPGWGGHLDYCNKKNSFMADIEKFDTIDDKINCTVDFYKDQQFCFPNVDHFSKLMRFCYEHPDEVKKRGRIASDFVRRNYSWELSGIMADIRLKEIYETKFR